jgi:hypothetical protein
MLDNIIGKKTKCSTYLCIYIIGRDRMVVGYTTTYATTTDVGSSNPDQLKFVSDLPQVGGFLRVLRFPPK